MMKPEGTENFAVASSPRSAPLSPTRATSAGATSPNQRIGSSMSGSSTVGVDRRVDEAGCPRSAGGHVVAAAAKLREEFHVAKWNRGREHRGRLQSWQLEHGVHQVPAQPGRQMARRHADHNAGDLLARSYVCAGPVSIVTDNGYP